MINTESRKVYITTVRCCDCGKVQEFETPDIKAPQAHAVAGLRRMGWFIDNWTTFCPECREKKTVLPRQEG